MKRAITILAITLFPACPLSADYLVEDRGTWPETWPKELEPLRESSRTFEGPLAPLLHYAIPFTNREKFESAWPQLLKVKSQGAPVVLRRGPNFFLGTAAKAGVCIHTPPADADKSSPAAPIAGPKNNRWETTTYIELIVDGTIVDLNRIPLPPETPIIDERFKERTTGR
jgi:hypothetical protein